MEAIVEILVPLVLIGLVVALLLSPLVFPSIPRRVRQISNRLWR